jgi:hypothetical protein
MKRHAKSLQSKAKRCQVTPLAQRGKFQVKSTSGSTYTITALSNGGFVCCCEWSKYHDTSRRPCTHVLAVELYLQNAGARAASFWADADDAGRQHNTTERVGRGLWMTTRKAAHNQTA